MNKAVLLRRCSSIALIAWLWAIPHRPQPILLFLIRRRVRGSKSQPGWVIALSRSAKDRAELSFPLPPGADDEDLALTVVFTEEPGAYLSVFWQPEQGDRQASLRQLDGKYRATEPADASDQSADDGRTRKNHSPIEFAISKCNSSAGSIGFVREWLGWWIRRQTEHWL